MKTPLIPLVMVTAVAACAVETSAEDISAWFAPSASKIMRDTRPGASPREWNLAAARNEVEACQLVLLSGRPVAGVTVSAAPLTGADGKGYLQPALFRVEYVPIKPEKVPYPDPLPPLAGRFDLQPGQAQPVWVSVRVPKDAAPGTYRGTVKVEAGTWTGEFPLSVKVWNFTLPDAPACVTAFGNAPGPIADQHGVRPDSPEGLALYRKYYEFLLDRRVSPYHIPVDLMAPEAAAYLNDPRMTSYVIPYAGKSDDELNTLIRRLIDGGWFAKGFFYVTDEPIAKAAYDELTAAAERLRRIEPRYRMVCPFWGNPEFDEKLRAKDVMFGRINVWCPHLLYFDTEAGIREFLQGRRKAGESVWWYVCNNPREPGNNLQIDQNAMAHRVLPWQQKREGVQGLLYWDTAAWSKTFIDDPWQNMDTIGRGYYGDGSLLYPGKKVGVDGPVSSLRLEVLRDGLEDFDYLAMSDRLLGPEATAGYVARVARALTDYERDPLKLEAVRNELGAALSRRGASSGL